MTKKIPMREKILDAAAEILETKGLKHLNTNALASAAGATPPTVYRHFENKEAVVIALAERFTEAEQEWLKSVKNTPTDEASIQSIIHGLIDGYWREAKRIPGIVALRGAMRVWPELKEVEERSLASSSELVAELLISLDVTLNRDTVKKIARHLVESVCATIDRCYTLEPKEQRWRIKELKLSTASYAISRIQAP